MRPVINHQCVASRYARPDEKIIEFEHPQGGGLISIQAMEDGTIAVSVYSCDSSVLVRSVPASVPVHDHKQGYCRII